jgi:hypothetical protein
MDKILYYPYINLPQTDWTLRTLLYYDNVGSIVPQEYFYSPDRNYEPFMFELVRNELVIPIDPIRTLDNPWEVSNPFLEFLQSKEFKLEARRRNFREGKFGRIHQDKFVGARIHADKFDHQIFYNLEQMGLAKKGEDSWYIVEKTTADYMMKFLASVISAKLEMLPTTDSFKRRYYVAQRKQESKKRETILTRLIPFPEDIDLNKLRKFKDKHPDLLSSFKNRIEQIVLDENITEGTELFSTKVEELELRRDELSAKMNESDFKTILFGSVCGIIGAYQGLVALDTTTSVITGFAGFAGAVYSALKIEKAEDVFDQSGMKYLALVDKRLR